MKAVWWELHLKVVERDGGFWNYHGFFYQDPSKCWSDSDRPPVPRWPVVYPNIDGYLGDRTLVAQA